VFQQEFVLEPLFKCVNDVVFIDIENLVLYVMAGFFYVILE
jgi:hypothetical protein